MGCEPSLEAHREHGRLLGPGVQAPGTGGHGCRVPAMGGSVWCSTPGTIAAGGTFGGLAVATRNRARRGVRICSGAPGRVQLGRWGYSHSAVSEGRLTP